MNKCLQAFPVSGRVGDKLTVKALFETTSEIVVGSFTSVYPFGIGAGRPSRTITDIEIVELPPKAGLKGKLVQVSFALDPAEAGDSAYWLGQCGNLDGDLAQTPYIAVNLRP